MSMFINDIKTEFYDVISECRVLVLVGFDVDALCACSILQYLLQCDNVLHTLIPVPGKEALVKAYQQHSGQIKNVILLNCGATVDIVELLQPKEDVTIFIADSHRPIDVYNIYNGSQVRLLMKLDESEDIPQFDDIFRDDSEDESEPEGRIDEKVLEHRRERRLWKEERQKILFDYTQFSFYGASTAVLMFDLAWKLSKDTNDLLWWAIIGLTEQHILGKIEQNKYLLEAGNLQGHVSRHNHISQDGNSSSVNCLQLTFEKDLQLALYRHWSLFESLKHTMYTACKFKVWTSKGHRRLCEFLAEIGIPLAQCKQKFSAMDINLKNNAITWFEDIAEKYGLDNIVYGSFVGKHGFRHKFCATDIVYTTIALLESVEKDSDPSERFLTALDSLSRKHQDVLAKGIELVKLQLIAVFKQVQTILDLRHVSCAGPYLYAVIEGESHDLKYFSSPSCLRMLARFLLRAHYSSTRDHRTKNLPLILVTSKVGVEGTSLVMGIPPVAEESSKNFFGKAFEQAAHKSRSSIATDYFDSSVIQIKYEDHGKFFDALVSLLS